MKNLRVIQLPSQCSGVVSMVAGVGLMLVRVIVCLLILWGIGFVAPLNGQSNSNDTTVAEPSAASNQQQVSEPEKQESKPATSLPWENQPTDSDLPRLTDLQPRDLLTGVNDSEFEHLIDFQPIEPLDDTLLKILFRVCRIGADHQFEFVNRTKEESLESWANQPATHRLKMRRLHGTAVRVERIRLIEPMDELFGMGHYYKVHVRPHAAGSAESTPPDAQQDTSLMLTICCRRIPCVWREKLPESDDASELGLNQTVGANALFLKIESGDQAESGNNESTNDHGTESDVKADLLFAAERIEWFPSQTDAADEKIRPSHLLLAKLGFDLGLFDSLNPFLQEANDEPTNPPRGGLPDSEFFYPLLDVSRRIRKEDLVSLSKSLATSSNAETGVSPEVNAESESMSQLPALPVVDLLRDGASKAGNIYQVSADIRNVTEVSLNSPYFRDRLQLDRYYQLDGFARLEQPLTIKTKAGEKIQYGRRFPVTICVTELPEGIETGTRLRHRIELPCIYVKNWSYSSQFVDKVDAEAEQVAPLFVGFLARVAPPPTPLQQSPTAWAVAALALVAGALWLGFLLNRKREPVRPFDVITQRLAKEKWEKLQTDESVKSSLARLSESETNKPNSSS
jgi:hypothetical protein